MMKESSLIFTSSRAAFILIGLGGLWMAVLGIVMIRDNVVAAPYDILVWILILCGALAIATALRELARRGPRIELNSKGIYSSAIGPGIIKWSDITYVSIANISGNHLLFIDVSNPHKYWSRQGFIRKLVSKTDFKTGYPPFKLYVDHLAEVTPQELEQIITDQIRRVRNGNPSTVHLRDQGQVNGQCLRRFYFGNYGLRRAQIYLGSLFLSFSLIPFVDSFILFFIFFGSLAAASLETFVTALRRGWLFDELLEPIVFKTDPFGYLVYLLFWLMAAGVFSLSFIFFMNNVLSS